MANTTITNLPLATSINGTEQIPAVQSSATVRLTVNQLVSFTSSTLPAPVVTIGGAVSGGTANNALYVSPSGTLGQFPYGTGVLNAIQIATGTNGAMVLLNGDAGTPTSLVLTNATGTPASLVLTNATGTPASINLTNATSLPVTGILATGTPSASTFLRGDSTWAPIVLTVGTTAISGATNGYLLYNNGGTLGSVAPTAASLSIGSPITGGTSGYGLYVDASNQLGEFAYGTGVRTALGVNVGSAGAPVLFNGAGGQPTSINLTGATALSLPIGSISATGTPSASTYLRGDGTWAAAGGGGVTVNTGVTNQLSYYSGASAISGNANATISGGALTLGVQSTTAGSIVLANTNVAARATTIQSSASASAAWTLTLPVSAGSAGNILSTNGAGVTSWVAASVGTVTSVGLTVATGAGGILSNSGTASPITSSGTYTLAVTGVAGGFPYFTSTSAWASSAAAMALNGVVYGGGASASPASTAAGTTGQVLIATTSNPPSWGQVSLTAGVTGSLPIGNGGTGQTTAAAGFNALSPVTTTGDLIVGNGTNSSTRLGIGSTSQVLTVVGGTAAWATPASGGVSTITFGSTGLTPATATSGAVTVAGTLAVASGGTGTTTSTGSGSVVLATSPTLVTPNLGDATATSLTANSVVNLGTSGLGGATRETLTANRTYYVATTGSDSNSGLSSGTPFLTIQKAINVVAALDIGVYNVTISVASGTYSAGAAISAAWVGTGTVTLTGNTTTPSNCLLSTTTFCVYVSGSGRLSVQGFKFTASASLALCYAYQGGNLTISGKCEFGSCGVGHRLMADGGYITSTVAEIISGTAGGAHYNCSNNGFIFCQNATWTASGTAASGAFAQSATSGVIFAFANSSSGTFTGLRYSASLNSVIQTNGGGANYFPGSAAGTTSTGGLYA